MKRFFNYIKYPYYFYHDVKRFGWKFAITRELLALFCSLTGAREIDIKYFEN
jgi:hypothetical protein